MDKKLFDSDTIVEYEDCGFGFPMNEKDWRSFDEIISLIQNARKTVEKRIKSRLAEINAVPTSFKYSISGTYDDDDEETNVTLNCEALYEETEQERLDREKDAEVKRAHSNEIARKVEAEAYRLFLELKAKFEPDTKK